MSRHGKRQTPAQKIQTDKMRRHGLALRSSPKGSAIDPADPRAVSKQRKKAIEEGKAHQRLIRNGRKREVRLKGKVHNQDEVITFEGEMGKILN